MLVCDVKELTSGERPKEKQTALPFPTALEAILVSFSSLFWSPTVAGSHCRVVVARHFF